MIISVLLMAATPSIAFEYSDRPPLAELAAFDLVVLDPSTPATALKQLGEAQALAYLSVGEVAADAAYRKQVPRNWKLAENPRWSSWVMDLTKPGYRKLLITQMKQAEIRGFTGFFFDTLDSHHLVDGRATQAKALLKFFKEARREFPEAPFIVNRGFELLDELRPLIQGLAAESLYFGVGGASGYAPVSAEDSAWLKQRLLDAKGRGLWVYALDYLPSNKRMDARELAQRITDDGFVPWVSNIEQEGLGVGSVEVLPRRVMLVYDSKEKTDLALHPLHRIIATPLEYLGLLPEYLDVQGSLPDGELAGHYAGVVLWTGGRHHEHSARLRQWLSERRREGLPILVLGGFGPEIELADWGISAPPSKGKGPGTLSFSDPSAHFEGPPPSRRIGFVSLSSKDPKHRAWLRYQRDDDVFDPIATTSWGGYALAGDLFVSLLDDETRWGIDPFIFFAAALKLPLQPAVDLTTESGRRRLFVHIDGDGSASLSEVPPLGRLSPEVLQERILDRFQIPHTISFVEAEVSPAGLHPKLSERLVRHAQEIYALPLVEPASHGFSHPFYWNRFEASGGREARLPVADKTISSKREVAGSVRYLNGLSPRPLGLFLWTGDALPGKASLAAAEEAGLLNLNGGSTDVTKTMPSLTHVGPVTRSVGPYLQVYAPMLNENVYTNDWTGPFYGFRRLSETFDLTGLPRRLKPLNIYYHFYSATKEASLRALEQVYTDALARNPIPMFAGDYVRSVHASRKTRLARGVRGDFVVTAGTRTLRLPEGMKLDLCASSGVAGVRQTKAGSYVALDPRGARLVPGASRACPGLLQSSGRVQRAKRSASGRRLELKLVAATPLRASVEAKSCTSRPPAKITRRGSVLSLDFGRYQRATLVCEGSR